MARRCEHSTAQHGTACTNSVHAPTGDNQDGP
jgi:hypothetical protein